MIILLPSAPHTLPLREGSHTLALLDADVLWINAAETLIILGTCTNGDTFCMNHSCQEQMKKELKRWIWLLYPQEEDGWDSLYTSSISFTEGANMMALLYRIMVFHLKMVPTLENRIHIQIP